MSTTLSHGGKYQYRVHRKKTEELCTTYPELKEYLTQTLKSCPDEYFKEGPRSSILKFKLIKNPEPEKHEINILAGMGLESNYYQDAHMNVQMFMLSYDQKTISIETPIWLKPEEIKTYQKIFETDKTLTGHIDIVRIEDNKIWIWDYKPKAHLEKYATTQTFFYALMLSKRTKIPLEKFRCGYFDEKNTYTFKPEEIINQNPDLLILQN